MHPRARHGRASEEIYPGASVTQEEAEFGAAMAAYQRRTGLRYPNACDVLREAKRLGYRKAIHADPCTTGDSQDKHFR